MAEIGSNIILGMAKGMEQAGDNVYRQADEISEGMLARFYHAEILVMAQGILPGCRSRVLLAAA